MVGWKIRSMHKRITDQFRTSARAYVDIKKSQVAAIGGNKYAQVFTIAALSSSYMSFSWCSSDLVRMHRFVDHLQLAQAYVCP